MVKVGVSTVHCPPVITDSVLTSRPISGRDVAAGPPVQPAGDVGVRHHRPPGRVRGAAVAGPEREPGDHLHRHGGGRPHVRRLLLSFSQLWQEEIWLRLRL